MLPAPTFILLIAQGPSSSIHVSSHMTYCDMLKSGTTATMCACRRLLRRSAAVVAVIGTLAGLSAIGLSFGKG